MNKRQEENLEVSRMRLDKSLGNQACIKHWSCSKQKSGLEVQKGLGSLLEQKQKGIKVQAADR